jgi:hypothetical protein
LGGRLLKEVWFRRYGEHEQPKSFERIVQSWDTANKAYSPNLRQSAPRLIMSLRRRSKLY